MDPNTLQQLKPELDSDTPLYLQLAQKLSQAIQQGLWPTGAALPSERDLAQWLAVSRVTARKALDLLVTSGLIKRCQGSGTFVNRPVEQSLSRLTSFSEMLNQRGLAPSSIWLSRGIALANPEEMQYLGLSPNSQVVRLKRLRCADQTIIALQHSVLPTSYILAPQQITDSLYSYLERAGFKIQRALQQVCAVNASSELAKLMNLRENQAVLLITRIGYLENNVAIELTKTYCLNEYYDFVAELTPVLGGVE